MIRAAAVFICLALSACMTAEEPSEIIGVIGDSEGLHPVGSQQRIDFGRAKIGVVDAVSRLLGRGPTDEFFIEECGAGPVTAVSWGDDLKLNFIDGALRGWVMQSDVLRSENGLRVGQTRSALEAAGIADFENTSIGVEFGSEGVFGLLNAQNELAYVWSGATCFFR